MMKTYRGARTFDGIEVWAEPGGGAPARVLAPRRDLRTFSKNGFEWGFEGAESSQLALALLADALDDDTAIRLSDTFMRRIVANFDNEWEISEAQVGAAAAALDAGG